MRPFVFERHFATVEESAAKLLPFAGGGWEGVDSAEALPWPLPPREGKSEG